MMRRTDIWAGWSLAAAALVTLLWLIPSQTTPAQSEHTMSPAMMPSVAAATVLLLALLLAVSGLVSAPAADEPHEEFGAEASGFGWKDWVDLSLWTGTSLVSMALLRHVGFMVAGVVLLAATMLFMGQRNPWVISATALGTPLSIWLIAWYAFSVALP